MLNLLNQNTELITSKIRPQSGNNWVAQLGTDLNIKSRFRPGSYSFRPGRYSSSLSVKVGVPGRQSLSSS